MTLIHGTQEDPAVYQGQAGYLAGDSAAGDSGAALCRRASGGADAGPSQGETATMGVAATFSARTAERTAW
jgi:beta-glucosidase